MGADLAQWIGDAVGPFAYVVLALMTAGEAAAFIGLFVPGETTMMLAGYLAFRGELDLWGAIVVATVAAIAGDSIGYEMGRRFGPRLREGRLGRMLGQEKWERAHETITRHGARAVVIGRFVGVLRAVVPAVVGDARMPYRKFLFWNTVGAVLWTPAIILIGYYAGDAYETVASVMGQFTFGAVVVAGVGWLAWKRWGRSGRPDTVAMTTSAVATSREEVGDAVWVEAAD